MMFGLTIDIRRRLVPLVALASALALGNAWGAQSVATPMAVVPTAVIYPGDLVNPDELTEVKVTNPNVRDDYVHRISDLDGMVATRTLLPGRVIPASSVRIPYAVERGKPVELIYSDGQLTITAAGMPLQNAAVGDLIRVRNTDTGVTVSGTVAADHTVQVAGR